MGLSIYYSGQFDQKNNLAEMIEEVKDIAEAFGWKYTLHSMEFPTDDPGYTPNFNDIFGISITAPQCDTLALTFLSNGRLVNTLQLKYGGAPSNELPEEYLYSLFCKTQFAGSKTHKMIVNLMRYISKKYFSAFELRDDSWYWETNDEAQLARAFYEYDILLDTVADGLRYVPRNEGETLEQYFNRILSGIK